MFKFIKYVKNNIKEAEKDFDIILPGLLDGESSDSRDLIRHNLEDDLYNKIRHWIGVCLDRQLPLEHILDIFQGYEWILDSMFSLSASLEQGEVVEYWEGDDDDDDVEAQQDVSSSSCDEDEVEWDAEFVTE